MNPLNYTGVRPLLNFCVALILLVGLAASAHAQKPINYQGRVTVGGVNFEGTGQFKFALIDNIAQATASIGGLVNGSVSSIIVERGGAGYVSPPSVTILGGAGSGATATAQVTGGTISGITLTNGGAGYTSFPAVIFGPVAAVIGSAPVASVWSNDGTSVGGSEPASAVSLPVSKGLYSVGLGDTSLGMSPVPASSLINAPVSLRIWFNDGINGFQLLSPDQALNAVPNARVAELAAYARAAGVAMNARAAGFAMNAVPLGHREFTVAGTYQFTIPDGVYRICVDAWGATGGNGALYAINGQYFYGGPGGPGAYCRKMFDVVPGQECNITIGAAGILQFFPNPQPWWQSTDGGATTFQIAGTSNGLSAGGGGGGGNASDVSYGLPGTLGVPDPSAAFSRTGKIWFNVAATAIGLVNLPRPESNSSIQLLFDGYMLLTW